MKKDWSPERIEVGSRVFFVNDRRSKQKNVFPESTLIGKVKSITEQNGLRKYCISFVHFDADGIAYPTSGWYDDWQVARCERDWVYNRGGNWQGASAARPEDCKYE